MNATFVNQILLVYRRLSAKRFIAVATEAFQEVAQPNLKFREYHSMDPAGLKYALYWHANNDNQALQHFSMLIQLRYPGWLPRALANCSPTLSAASLEGSISTWA